jgi:hypothetical protein
MYIPEWKLGTFVRVTGFLGASAVLGNPLVVDENHYQRFETELQLSSCDKICRSGACLEQPLHSRLA